jgi:maltooligosyltrehalose trehalohydrolase
MNQISAEVRVTGNCFFSVWAPEKERMILHIVYPEEKELEMKKNDQGYFVAVADDIKDGCRYFYKPDNEKDYPDPGSNFQPEGVHGPSQVVDHNLYKWNDSEWKGILQKDLIFYELHVGTFSEQGTFEAIIPYIDVLAETGINALELMPISQFPGNRNWGYDGVYPYSVHNTYGGPEGLKRLVDACHQKGIAVFLDIVLNHVGPEGNYFPEFGPYFSKTYNVPWGEAINFDQAWSDEVREFFAGNPCFWFEKYHVDGVRVDAIHMMFDSGAVHFWELAMDRIRQMEQKLGKKLYMIAESDFNNPRVIKSTDAGGYGFDAQWLDDFHHALYVLIDEKGQSRYEDFGRYEQLAKAYKDGFVHSGELVKFRKKKHGASSAGIPGDKFVTFNQNHDQIGNRVKGERLSMLVSFAKQKLAAAALLLSPYLPLLFMGEEYGEDTPFFYFISHSDKELIKAVREGRKREFEGYKWDTEPADPQDDTTFRNSIIKTEKRLTGKYRILHEWSKKLIKIRKSEPAMKNMSKDGINFYINDEKGFTILRKSADELNFILAFFNLSESKLDFFVPSYSEEWTKILDSKETEWCEDNEKAFPSPRMIKASNTISLMPFSIVVYDNAKEETV